MFYKDTLDELIEKCDIVKIISRYTMLTRDGEMHYAKCPFHKENAPSFAVNPQTKTYHCFGCGKSGNVISFIMQIKGTTFVEAVNELASDAGIFLPEISKTSPGKEKTMHDMYRIAARYYYENMNSPVATEALRYTQNRELTAETMRGFGLGYSGNFGKDLCEKLKNQFSEEDILGSGLVGFGKVYSSGKETMDYYDKFWSRLMFPVMDEYNKVVGFGGRVLDDGKPKYINSPETLIFDKGSLLYGLNRARYSKNGSLMLVEGYMDVISMHQAGFTNAVASLGTALTENQARLIRKYADKVFVAYDSDAPGLAATLKAIPILKTVGLNVKVVSVNPAKDPDEFVKRFGRDAFEKRLSLAISGDRFILQNTEKKDSVFFNNLADILLETL